MSGGHWDYICYRVEEMAGYTHDKEIDMLVKDFAQLLHDLEWYDSADIDEDTYRKTVREFKKKWLGGANREERLIEIVNRAYDELRNELINMIGGGSDD